MKLALFDVDGTLVRGLSSQQGFVLYLLARGLLGPRQILAWCRFALRWLPRHGRHIGKKNKAYLAGLPEKKVRDWGAAYVRRRLIRRLNPAVRARLTAHVRAGDRVILLTGTPDFLAAPLAALLGAHGYRAARCACRAGVVQSKPLLDHPYAEEKRRIAEELCAAQGCGMPQVVAYADSATDLALLRAVGKPVAVNADRGLQQAALRLGWERI